MQVNDAMVAKAAESDAAFDGRTWLAMPKSERERYMERSRRSLTRREGFPAGTAYHWPSEFVDFFCRSHKGCTRDSIVTRIEFVRRPSPSAADE